MGGQYKLIKKTMQLVDSRGGHVAHIVVRPVGGVALGAPDGFEPLEVVSVVRSEIMREIQEPANSGAYFVLPSQMNGAEYPDFRVVINSVQDYTADYTAGPRGQLAAHPAVAQFFLDNATRLDHPGGLDTVYDVLAAVAKDGCEAFTLLNGYLSVPSEAGPPEIEAVRRHLWRLKTMAACDVRAAGLTPDFLHWSPGNHLVSLVYASAVPVNAYNNPAFKDSDVKVQQEVSSLFLRGAYFGALRLALERRPTDATTRTTVFFSPVGGGVFNNSFEAIARSISEALEMANAWLPKHDLASQLDVRLLTWEGRPGEAAEFELLLARYGKLRLPEEEEPTAPLQ